MTQEPIIPLDILKDLEDSDRRFRGVARIVSYFAGLSEEKRVEVVADPGKTGAAGIAAWLISQSPTHAGRVDLYYDLWYSRGNSSIAPELVAFLNKNREFKRRVMECIWMTFSTEPAPALPGDPPPS